MICDFVSHLGFPKPDREAHSGMVLKCWPGDFLPMKIHFCGLYYLWLRSTTVNTRGLEPQRQSLSGTFTGFILVADLNLDIPQDTPTSQSLLAPQAEREPLSCQLNEIPNSKCQGHSYQDRASFLGEGGKTLGKT